MKKVKAIDDFIKITSGVISSLDGAKDYSKEKIKEKIIQILEDLDLVTNKDFNMYKEMCLNARKENAKLKARIDKLESLRELLLLTCAYFMKGANLLISVSNFFFKVFELTFKWARSSNNSNLKFLLKCL